ncbi:MAG: sugar phosphate isomerase/epimerase [Spirochaetales bacterium]|uniref:Sugar phosphate isomerase/epimerase n=1 Tax=Candidatus Thalassospirochaeta sargassi TaxID=3119039 RepID=A0AAJ1IEP5_9SPIO|nr:sugar phosphate isomerase/epimerase [Spirochaetales bacterium]
MNLSCSMWSLDRTIQENDLKQIDFLKWARGHHLKYVELVSYYLDKEGNAGEIRKTMSEMDMHVSCYTVLQDFSVPDSATNAAFRKDLKNAAILEAPFVRVLSGGTTPGDTGERETIIKELKQACEAADKLGITLLLENVGPHACASGDSLSIIKDVNASNFRINFDTANPLLVEEDPLEALENLIDFTAYVHFKDFITEDSAGYKTLLSNDPSREQKSLAGKSMTGTAAGEGVIPFEEMFRCLKNAGYNGFVSLEYEGTGDAMADTLTSLNYLENLVTD